MKNKPILPLAHGIIDYGFTASQWILPPALHLNKKAVNLYRFLGANLFTYTAFTQHAAALKPVIPFRTHGKIDGANLAVLGLLALYSGIRKDKKALLFHGVLFSLAVANVLLTDWSRRGDSTHPTDSDDVDKI